MLQTLRLCWIAFMTIRTLWPAHLNCPRMPTRRTGYRRSASVIIDHSDSADVTTERSGLLSAQDTGSSRISRDLDPLSLSLAGDDESSAVSAYPFLHPSLNTRRFLIPDQPQRVHQPSSASTTSRSGQRTGVKVSPSTFSAPADDASDDSDSGSTAALPRDHSDVDDDNVDDETASKTSRRKGKRMSMPAQGRRVVTRQSRSRHSPASDTASLMDLGDRISGFSLGPAPAMSESSRRARAGAMASSWSAAVMQRVRGWAQSAKGDRLQASWASSPLLTGLSASSSYPVPPKSPSWGASFPIVPSSNPALFDLRDEAGARAKPNSVGHEAHRPFGNGLSPFARVSMTEQALSPRSPLTPAMSVDAVTWTPSHQRSSDAVKRGRGWLWLGCVATLLMHYAMPWFDAPVAASAVAALCGGSLVLLLGLYVIELARTLIRAPHLADVDLDRVLMCSCLVIFLWWQFTRVVTLPAWAVSATVLSWPSFSWS